jgi:hypothetical protein
MTPAEQTDARWTRLAKEMPILAEADECERQRELSGLRGGSSWVRALLQQKREELWNEALELLNHGH